VVRAGAQQVLASGAVVIRSLNSLAVLDGKLGDVRLGNVGREVASPLASDSIESAFSH
jgi:hypothetical protein